MKNIVIIYHGDCSDGFGGAYAAWKKFGNKATYIAGKHHEPPVTGLKDKEIYFIDFIYPPEVVKKLLKTNRRVTAIDHHISSEKLVKTTFKYSYAAHNSGSVLAWKYFHPVRGRGTLRALAASNGVHPQKSVPWLLRYIEDTDIWKHILPHTKEVFAYQNLLDYDFKIWDKLVKEIENPKTRRTVVAKGGIILHYEDLLVERLMANAEVVKFGGYKTLAVNSPILKSELGNAIVNKMGPIGIVWSEKEGVIAVSLRSDGKADVAKLAEKYGGGGHRAAAGFSFPASQKFPWRPLISKS